MMIRDNERLMYQYLFDILRNKKYKEEFVSVAQFDRFLTKLGIKNIKTDLMGAKLGDLIVLKPSGVNSTETTLFMVVKDILPGDTAATIRNKKLIKFSDLLYPQDIKKIKPYVTMTGSNLLTSRPNRQDFNIIDRLHDNEYLVSNEASVDIINVNESGHNVARLTTFMDKNHIRITYYIIRRYYYGEKYTIGSTSESNEDGVIDPRTKLRYNSIADVDLGPYLRKIDLLVTYDNISGNFTGKILSDYPEDIELTFHDNLHPEEMYTENKSYINIKNLSKVVDTNKMSHKINIDSNKPELLAPLVEIEFYHRRYDDTTPQNSVLTILSAYGIN